MKIVKTTGNLKPNIALIQIHIHRFSVRPILSRVFFFFVFFFVWILHANKCIVAACNIFHNGGLHLMQWEIKFFSDLELFMLALLLSL